MSILDDAPLEHAVCQLENHFRQRVAGLIWYHRLGVLLAPIRMHAGYGEAWAKAIRERFGVSRDYLYKSLKFAELFTAAEAAGWDGRITWSKLVTVLSVGSKRRRDALLRGAAALGQSCRGLSAAVGRQTVSRRPCGGRRPADPLSKGVGRDVAAFLRLLDRVERFRGGIFDSPVNSLLGALRAGVVVPARVGHDLRRLQAALLNLDRLQAAGHQLGAVLDERDAIRQVDPPATAN